MTNAIVAELVGTVLKVVVEKGQPVAAGDTIVTEVAVREGDTVQEGDVLAVVG
jgi:biotin carboxyl carrier protein